MNKKRNNPSVRFKKIDLEKYKTSHPTIFETTISLVLLVILIFGNFIFKSTFLTGFYIFSIFWFILYFFILFDSRIASPLKKNALTFYKHHMMDKDFKEQFELLEKTYCISCGIVLNADTFKNKIFEQPLKPTHFFYTDGYFCKNCFKKYYKIKIIRLGLTTVALYIFYFLILILYDNYLGFRSFFLILIFSVIILEIGEIIYIYTKFIQRYN